MKHIGMPRKKTVLLLASITTVVVIAVVVFVILVTRDPAKTSTTQIPQYETLLPAGDSIQDLGGWQRISPSSADPVFAYADTVNKVAVTVSQQPLPSSFKENTDAKVADLAKAYNATDKITADGITVYIGTSAKGPQSTIFTKDNLLILIKSEAKIEDKTWITYIDSLK